VCAIFRDEAPYLAEWVAFHRIQGVERFWLYDNLSTDDWRFELEPEMRSGIVTVTPWPQEPGQKSAYIDCLNRHRNDARWIAFIDLDEFLFSPGGRSLPEVLRDFERHPSVVVNWRMYGTNGYQVPPEGLVVENYLMRGPDSFHDNRFLKPIVYPRKTAGPSDGPHYFRCRGIVVGEDHQPVRGYQREPPTVDLLRINHYCARSLAGFARKRARPSVWDGRLDYSNLPPDEVRDEVALRFVPGLKAALGGRTSTGR
jgi:hypothetical protein